MRIDELVARTGVSHRLLRYYEEQGLLAPGRSALGHRDYTAADEATVVTVRRLLAAGLSTATIGAVLPCLRRDADRLVPTCPDLVRELRGELARIERAIEDLSASRDALEVVVAAGVHLD